MLQPSEFPDSFKNLAQLKDPLIYTLHEGNGAENPFKRIQNRLSILVEDQLPDFIQSDYGMFVTFIKAYYEFLETKQTKTNCVNKPLTAFYRI